MIDLDHNATTALDPRVREAMARAPSHGNPSSTHALGRAARAALDGARREAAGALGCEPGEVVFTASGSGPTPWPSAARTRPGAVTARGC